MVDNPSSSSHDLTEGSQEEMAPAESVDHNSSPPQPEQEPVIKQDSTEEGAQQAPSSEVEEPIGKTTEEELAAETVADQEQESVEEVSASETPEEETAVTASEEVEEEENTPVGEQEEEAVVTEEEAQEEAEEEPAVAEEEVQEEAEEEPAVAEEEVQEEEVEEEEEEAAAETDEEAEDKKKWYVVKVQSGREESIKEAIERRVKIEGLEEYFGEILIPTDKEKVKVKGQWKTREKRRFPGYIMARVEYNDQILYLFRETSGVGDFVGGGINQDPQPMSEKEVDHMIGISGKEREKPAGEGEPSPFNLGDHVKIKEGLFKDLEGEVKEIMEDKAQIRVETMVMGRPVSVELEYWQVEDV